MQSINSSSVARIHLFFVLKAGGQKIIQPFRFASEIEVAKHGFESACTSIFAHIGVFCGGLNLAISCASKDVLLRFVKEREEFFGFRGLRDRAHDLDDFVVERTRFRGVADRHPRSCVQTLYGVPDKRESHWMKREGFLFRYRFCKFKLKIVSHIGSVAQRKDFVIIVFNFWLRIDNIYFEI